MSISGLGIYASRPPEPESPFDTLMDTIKAGKTQRATDLVYSLERNSPELLQPDREGKTPLMAAVLAGNFDLIKILCTQARESLDLRDARGDTPLRKALQLNYLEIASVLMFHYASVYPEDLLLQKGNPEIFKTLLNCWTPKQAYEAAMDFFSHNTLDPREDAAHLLMLHALAKEDSLLAFSKEEVTALLEELSKTPVEERSLSYIEERIVVYKTHKLLTLFDIALSRENVDLLSMVLGKNAGTERDAIFVKKLWKADRTTPLCPVFL